MPKDPLAREQEMVVQIACHALMRTIEQYSPVGTDTLPIAAVAIGRMFADLINNLSSAPEIVDIVNRGYLASAPVSSTSPPSRAAVGRPNLVAAQLSTPRKRASSDWCRRR